ncbi:PREDICTED: butyrophilin subfamily 1 member A1-like [Elephantulus edwardii]|uniref:butyrophilin subfamily 1 member A1-like n=1 Tax=Elephantulus edwardii TaxID=28737 RepID=UPI0003F0BFF8|nr:PREDICTED: butyrophilin subfamily 1 member A1-like [Elephantulus edwardii]
MNLYLSIRIRDKRFGGGAVQKSEEIGKLKKDIAQMNSARFQTDWKKNYFKAVDVTLDPDTAHPNLMLTEERSVTWRKESQDLPDNPQRFSSLPCVLGQQAITSGRCYWEVEVGNIKAWDLGICRDNVIRKGKIVVTPQNGFWAIRFHNNEFWALSSPETAIMRKSKPDRICIFLEYEDRRISFYNMANNSHIYTFDQCSFYGSLRPFFRLWPNESKNLTICQI